ncbi:hypothetical protein DU504_16655 [Haloplanus salinus]|uniref:Uncharacterized protein n=1 Tax=Haloplanus salinus TaxID=1126245 RepID=A0A368N1M8_9EURY|nr:hypothetical protein [Haloplanus salinus]RCU44388.1 hypothetical protein DU504_16655 [Haloplanus salinus]
MNSSNTADKNLPATVEATTHKDPNGTADSRTDARRSPYFRDYRKEQERRRSTDTAGTTTLVTRLAGLLWAIVDQAAADRSTRDADVATDTDADQERFTERTASKTDFGTRAEPVDGLYGYTPDGDPVVPERGQLMRARTNANGQPADALLEPDAAGDLATWTPGNASSNFVDPTGEQIVGVASGLDESATRTAAPETTAPAAVDDLQAYDRPEEFEDDDTTTGIETANLEVLRPGGEYVRLGDLLAEPEQFAGTSLASIERPLALKAEKQRVTDGICRPGELSDEIELVGHAKWLNNRFDELAEQRPTTTEIAATRAEAATQARDERLRPLLELDSDTHDQICEMANRLLSEDFEKVHEVRKQPLTLAIALAKRISRDVEPASALLRQAEAEANDPRNIQTIGNVRYMSTRQTKGRFSTQGRVAILFENTHPGIKQAGVLQDDTGSIRFAIWKKSEWDETRPTPDPTDVSGRTLIRSHRFPELAVGDLVRAKNVVKGWYGDEATFETRRDSELTILKRAADDSKDDTATSETATTHERRPRQRRRTDPKTTGTPIPKNPIAYWRGSERWVFPITDWTPDWWLAQENVETVEQDRSEVSMTTGRKVTPEQ